MLLGERGTREYIAVNHTACEIAAAVFYHRPLVPPPLGPEKAEVPSWSQSCG
jgi:hypothetical protein